jgi:hypothetical protein
MRGERALVGSVGCPYCQHASGDRDIFPSVLRHLRLNAPQHAGDPTWVAAAPDKFRGLPDVGARTATLAADKDDFYKMREAFPEAMIALPGKSHPDSDLTAACAALILPRPTADLK